MEQDLEARVTALEAQVAQLEQCLATPSPTSHTLPTDFWVLNGLQEREIDGVTFAGHVSAHGQSSVQWQYGLPTSTFLQQTWEDAAPSLAALGHPARLRLLKAILEGQTATTDLSHIENLGSTGKLYHHLRELVAVGWLKPAGRGHHRVPPERVVPLLVILAATEALSPAGETA